MSLKWGLKGWEDVCKNTLDWIYYVCIAAKHLHGL